MAPLSLLLLLFLSLSTAADDLTSVVFKGCSTQKFPTPSYSDTLQTLLSALSVESTSAKFYRTTAGSGDESFSGLFQCRSDLSTSDCSDCVGKIPKFAHKLCPDSVAARVQLTGCYVGYEVSGFTQAPDTEFLYKVCGSGQGNGGDFGALVKSALGEIVKGVGNGTGFYTGDYESVYVLGQCEGDLGTADCVDCVKNAVDRAESDCGDSISGQVYLQKCYISYNYYQNGVISEPSRGKGHNTQKTVAIVVGAVAGFGLLIAVLMFLKSAFKKRDSKY